VTGRILRWWRVLWAWPNDPADRRRCPPAETVTLRPRPVPLPMPRDDEENDRTHIDLLRVAGYLDTGMRPRGMHHGRSR